MSLQHVQDQWDEMGRRDPLTAILCRPEREHVGWNVEEFFTTGRQEIREALAYIERSGIVLQRKKALDFGCGVGRLTQALGDHFEEVYGIDIAPSMIELANQYNRHGNKCRYRLNAADDLAFFPDNTFDLIYTVITLQHMHPRFAMRYIRELYRMLAPGGALLFQVPNGPLVFFADGGLNVPGLILRIVPKGVLDATYRKIRYAGQVRPEIFWIPRRTVVRLLSELGARLVDVKQIREPVYLDCRYLVTKN